MALVEDHMFGRSHQRRQDLGVGLAEKIAICEIAGVRYEKDASLSETALEKYRITLAPQ